MSTVDQEFDFRKSRWGMTAEEVVASETAPLIEQSDAHLAFDGDVQGMSCVILYGLSAGKLVLAKYLMMLDTVSKTAVVQQAWRLRHRLIDKYGLPRTDDGAEPGKGLSFDYEEWSNAVIHYEFGFTGYGELWKTLRTQILLWLKVDDPIAFVLHVIYQSNQHAEEIAQWYDQQAARAASRDNLDDL